MSLSKLAVRRVLAVLGAVGVAVTSYISVKCSRKADQKTTKKEKAKCYIPAMVSGAATCACIFGNHHLSSREITALTATASFAIANRDKLAERIKPYFSKEEHEAILEASREDASKDILRNPAYEWTGYGYMRFIDGISGRSFQSSMEAVENGERQLKERLRHGMSADLNDLHRYWGLKTTDYGRRFSWVPDERYSNYGIGDPVDFKHTIVEDTEWGPVCLIDIYQYPEELPFDANDEREMIDE